MKKVDIISKVVGRDGAGKPVGGGISIPMGNYVLKSDFESLKSMFNDFLEGDDTDSVINRWKDLEAFLNGISEDNTLDSILKAYVTLSGTQTITGEKNFTGGLKVNGSPIVYDSRGFWKLEGDLLVTGGVTMYGNDSDFVPSTIMDAILYDNTTLGINAQGQLYVKDSVGGATTLGGLSNVDSSVDDMFHGLLFNQNGTWISADNTTIRSYLGIVNTLGGLTNVGSWADSVAPQDRIMYQAANSSQWVAKNLSDLAVGGVTGNYLPLSGGTLTDGLTINQTTRSALVLNEPNGGRTEIVFQKSGSTKGAIRLNDSNYLESLNTNKYQWELLLTSDNYSSYALPLSGGTINGSGDYLYVPLYINALNNQISGITFKTNGTERGHVGYSAGLGIRLHSSTAAGIAVSDSDVPIFYTADGSIKNTIWHSGNDGSGSGLDADLLDGKQPSELNVGSATKLQTARTIWGQSFDGTSNLIGSAHIGQNTNGTATIDAFSGFAYFGCDAVANGSIISTTGAYITINGKNGNIGVGTASPQTKLSVQGNIDTYTSSGDYSGIIGFNRKSSVGGLYISSYHGHQIHNYKGDLQFYIEKTDKTWLYPLVIQGSTGNVGIGTTSPSFKLHVAGDILATGGITMYSARKLKTIQDERGLSLEELSVIKPTRFIWKDGRDNKIHIGGIADDVQKVLPEVIYKADNDTLTMDYGNAAFAIAASLIKPVINHEQRIKALEEENKRLKEEVEQLKWNIA